MSCAEMDDPNNSLGAVDDACMYEEDCAEGLICKYQDESQMACAYPGAVGDACVYLEECAEGLRC